MNTKILNVPNNRKLIAKANKSKTLPKKVAIIYSDAKREYFSTYEEFLTEKGAREEAATFIPYLNKLGVEGCLIPGNADITKHLKREKPDMAINICATVKGYDYLGATVPSVLELLEIPYTGAAILGFSLGCHKYLTYTLLQQHGIPVPRFQLMTNVNSPVDPSLRYPLILKLNEEHSNVEIKRESVVMNEKELRNRLRYLFKTYDQDVLVSEFIEGREFAAFVFESTNRKVYVAERIFHIPGQDPKIKFLDYDLAWKTNDDLYEKRVEYKKYHDALLDALVKKAFDVARMDDYGKFDVRMDRFGNYYFIDANANCHFSPPENWCEMAVVMKMHGVPFAQLLKRLMQNTMREWGY